MDRVKNRDKARKRRDRLRAAGITEILVPVPDTPEAKQHIRDEAARLCAEALKNKEEKK